MIVRCPRCGNFEQLEQEEYRDRNFCLSCNVRNEDYAATIKQAIKRAIHEWRVKYKNHLLQGLQNATSQAQKSDREDKHSIIEALSAFKDAIVNAEVAE